MPVTQRLSACDFENNKLKGLLVSSMFEVASVREARTQRSVWTVLLNELPKFPQTNCVGNGRRDGVRKREHFE